MNLDDTRRLLRARSALTSQPYSADVVGVWQAALETVEYTDASVALVAACRVHERVTPAHIIEHIPRRPVSTQRVYAWSGPTDEGRAVAAEIRAHLRGAHVEASSSSCPSCRVTP